MTLTFQNNFFIFKCSFHEKGTAKDANFRWDFDGTKTGAKCWFTDDPATALRLAKYADGTCRAALEEKKKERAEAVELSRAKDADIEIPRPEGIEYLPYQRAGIQFMYRRPAVLLADEMGLGKTVEILGVINACEDIRNVLVIVPASLKINWKREADRFLVRKFNFYMCGGTHPSAYIMHAMREPRFVIVNYDITFAWKIVFQQLTWDLLVLDECHFCKGDKTRRTRSILGRTRGKPKDGEAPDLPIPAKRKIFATGTPILNNVIELWPIIHSLDPQTWSSYWKFAQTFADAHTTRFGLDTSGAKNLEILQETLRSTVMLRRLKKDVLLDLPPKRRQVLTLAAEGFEDVILEEMEAYEKSQESIVELRAAVELAKASENEEDYKEAVESLNDAVSVAFTEISRLRHQTALAKVPAVIEHVETILNETDKVIVFCYHRDVIEQISCHFRGANGKSKRMPPSPNEGLDWKEIRQMDGHQKGDPATADRLDVPLQMRDGKESKRSDIIGRDLRPVPTVCSSKEGGEFKGDGVRQVDGTKGRSTEELGEFGIVDVGMQMPVRISEEGVRGQPAGRPFDGLYGLPSHEEGGLFKNEALQAVAKREDQGREGGPAILDNRGGYSGSGSLPTTRDTDSIHHQKVLVEQPVDRQDNTGKGIHQGERVDYQLEGERDKARRNAGRAKDDYPQSGNKNAGGCSVILYGGMSAEEKDTAVTRFQNDPTCRVFVGQITSAGLGLTLTASSTVVFGELDWTPSRVTQAEDRAHRIGQRDSVLIQHLVIDGSLDAKMAKTLVHKQELIDKAMDNITPAETEAPIVIGEAAATESATRKQIEKEAAELSPEAVRAVHQGLRILDGVCDGAAQLDGQGFNRIDSFIGKSLAKLTSLTPRQCILGRRILTKYARQLPLDILEAMRK